MPIYEFECLDCKAVFEIIVASADRVGKVVCRTCAGTNVRKTISAGSYRVHKSTAPPAAGCPAGSKFT